MALHLRAVECTPPSPADQSRFPFTVPVVRSLRTLPLKRPVTCFVGENGSGKSTVLEAVAVAARLPTVGADEAASDGTLADIRMLASHLRLVWSRRPSRGFFLRAEDFFGFAQRVNRQRREASEALARIEEDYADRSPVAKAYASMPHRRGLHEIDAMYGDGLDSRSHGEAFLALFQSRLVPNGLYLLDEPETPLSPLRQLALLSLLMRMVEEGCQFIIATHSPMLLSFPGAELLQFDGDAIRAVAYDDVEHVTLTRDFLNCPERYLRDL